MAKRKATLIKELTVLMEQIDMDGLTFLKEQAAVLIYNQEVSRKNKEQTKKAEKTVSNKTSQKNEKPQVYIEQLSNGKFFNIRIKENKLFMDLQEIKALYKIVKAAESPEEGGRRLYKWFKKERSDVLSEGGIKDAGSTALFLIYKELLETFSAD